MHSDPCLKMSTHPILGHHHNHEGKCNVENAKAIGEYVYYRDKIHEDNIKILTLGGSTTDGWYTHYAEGQTWPKLLDEICFKNSKKFNNCSVVNGGVGVTLKFSDMVSNVAFLICCPFSSVVSRPTIQANLFRPSQTPLCSKTLNTAIPSFINVRLAKQ